MQERKTKRKKKRRQRPVIKITSGSLELIGVALDAAILLLLGVWFIIEMWFLE